MVRLRGASLTTPWTTCSLASTLPARLGSCLVFLQLSALWRSSRGSTDRPSSSTGRVEKVPGAEQTNCLSGTRYRNLNCLLLQSAGLSLSLRS